MSTSPARRVVRFGAAIAALALSWSCGDDDDAGLTAASDTTAPSSGSTMPSTVESTAPSEATTSTPAGTTTPTSGTPAETVPPTFETVTTSIVGTAVGGSAGATEAVNTDEFSEAVRNPDGTCSGWSGPGGTWTQGLESGAPVVFLARDSDTQIGTGAIGSSRWEDVGTDREQWNCVFPFEGEVEGEPESFRIKIADLPPWVVVRDATDPSSWVVSIDTTVRIDGFSECDAPGAGRDAVASWDSVGTYWSRGVPEQLCGSGLAVVGVERPCRPPDIASEHIVRVTRADDPSVVLEDAGGLLVDPASLRPGTEVIVHVATGRPCG